MKIMDTAEGMIMLLFNGQLMAQLGIVQHHIRGTTLLMDGKANLVFYQLEQMDKQRFILHFYLLHNMATIAL